MACARPIVFGPKGWMHRFQGTCTTISVAWPPPGAGDDDDDADDQDAA